MPQMAPLMWLNLFLMFILIFLNFSSMNYFSFIYKKSSKINSFLKKSSTWKW